MLALRYLRKLIPFLWLLQVWQGEVVKGIQEMAMLLARAFLVAGLRAFLDYFQCQWKRLMAVAPRPRSKRLRPEKIVFKNNQTNQTTKRRPWTPPPQGVHGPPPNTATLRVRPCSPKCACDSQRKGRPWLDENLMLRVNSSPNTANLSWRIELNQIWLQN